LWNKLLNTPSHIYRLSNQQREPGKMSRPGKPLKNKTQLPVYIVFTFYPVVGYLRCTGKENVIYSSCLVALPASGEFFLLWNIKRRIRIYMPLIVFVIIEINFFTLDYSN